MQRQGPEWAQLLLGRELGISLCAREGPQEQPKVLPRPCYLPGCPAPKESSGENSLLSTAWGRVGQHSRKPQGGIS